MREGERVLRVGRIGRRGREREKGRERGRGRRKRERKKKEEKRERERERSRPRYTLAEMYDEIFFRCEDQLLVSDKEMDAKDKHIQQCTKTQEERKNELVRQ